MSYFAIEELLQDALALYLAEYEVEGYSAKDFVDYVARFVNDEMRARKTGKKLMAQLKRARERIRRERDLRTAIDTTGYEVRG